MNATDISKELYKVIQDKEVRGQIHSVFDNSFNVLDENSKLISFLGPNKPMAPYSIRIKEKISFLDLGLEKGQQLTFFKDFVSIGSTDIVIHYNKALLWDSSPILFQDKRLARDSIENVFTKLSLMAEFILNEGKKEGIFPLLKTLKDKIKYIDKLFDDTITLSKKEDFIKDRFLSFMDSYISEDVEKLPQSASKVVGYGIGLTPSMDDFLSGIMASRIYLSSYLNLDLKKAYEINEAIIKNINNKTTLVSQEMMKCSSRGEVNEDFRSLIISLLANRGIDDFYKYLEKVSDFGETSGTDIICGVYIGSLIMLNEYLGG